MTTTIQIYGRLGRAPEQRTTAAGKAMVTGAMVVVDLGRDGEMPEWFSLVASHEVVMDGQRWRGALGVQCPDRYNRECSPGAAGEAKAVDDELRF